MLSPEERIRRAEEIYYQRKRQTTGVRVASKNVNSRTKVDYFLVKKMLLQILICLIIYIIFYLLSHTEYFFSESVLQKSREILAYDINFEKMYQDGIYYWDQMKNWFLAGTKQEEKTENEVENALTENVIGEEENTENTIGENAIPENTVEENNPVTEENIGGAEEQTPTSEETPLTQMEQDANAIKTYSLIKPIEGTITSRFGLRNPTTPTVPKNHTGIDIAASVGTVIKAAMDGTVTLASSEGDYGNHLKIQIDDIEVIYAHCSKLYLKEGDTVKQGDAIAEVGATGNVTGPHLHLEFRKEGRYVDPDMIMEF